MLLCVGLTKFLRSRKCVNNLPSSWTAAVPAPTNAKQLKIKENKEIKELREKKERKDKKGNDNYHKNDEINDYEESTVNTEITENKEETINLNQTVNTRNSDERDNKKGRGRDERGDRKSNSIRSDVRTESSAPVRVDHVCIDMNQILHASFRSSADPSHCMAKVCTCIPAYLFDMYITLHCNVMFSTVPFARAHVRTSIFFVYVFLM